LSARNATIISRETGLAHVAANMLHFINTCKQF
jgi:hypothetical protein